jgi:hypothetical protein
MPIPVEEPRRWATVFENGKRKRSVNIVRPPARFDMLKRFDGLVWDRHRSTPRIESFEEMSDGYRTGYVPLSLLHPRILTSLHLHSGRGLDARVALSGLSQAPPQESRAESGSAQPIRRVLFRSHARASRSLPLFPLLCLTCEESRN